MYKPTLFDRHGPAAADRLKAFGYGVMVFGLVFGVITLEFGHLSLWMFLLAAAAGAATSLVGIGLANAAGNTWLKVAVSGASTPYEEQYSRQQALVMQGKVNEALASYEDIIAGSPKAIEPRVLAAELYAKDDAGARRAAELLREVQGIPHLPSGRDVYVTNRLVDLLIGPLRDPGRAAVELRRLVIRYPGTTVAERAREALARIKASRSNSP
ncbi:MAG TPA: hypothetical protein VGJ18_16910 [Gemmatimonadaceae bacterium]|jgi:hypothetical protein